jgi:hypothetical protein
VWTYWGDAVCFPCATLCFLGDAHLSFHSLTLCTPCEGSMPKTRRAPVDDTCINISFPGESYRDMVYVVTVTLLAFVQIAVCLSSCSVHFKLLLICAYTPRYASSIQERLDEWSQPRGDAE